MFYDCLCLAPGKHHCGSAVVLFGCDFAKSCLIFRNILLQCEKQLLGILGSHDNARLHLGLRCVGSQAYHVEEKLVCAMSDYGEVSIFAGCNLGCQFDFYLFLFHNL